jgi:hypothetical protein
MWDMLNGPAARAAVGIGLVMVITYLGVKFTRGLRHSTCKDDTSHTGLAAEFEEMQTEGDISPEELRNIKAVMERNRCRS